MDAFLSQRDGTEGSAVNSMKSEFLTLWDGLLSERKGKSANEGDGTGKDDRGWLGGKKDAIAALENGAPLLPAPPIIVLGATNRPYDVDPAILRRLPRSFEIPLPSLESRLQLLKLFLERQSMTKAARDFLPTVARKTEGYSGSDLKEVCRAAAWEPVRELTTGASRRAAGCKGAGDDDSSPVLKRTSSGFPPRGTKARPVDENDFLLAIQKVKKTGESAQRFHKKEFLRKREERASMATEISRATGKGGRKTRIKGDDARTNGDDGTNPPQAVNLDMQQLVAMAMAAASSMNSANGNGGAQASGPPSLDGLGPNATSGSGQESDDEEREDDAPPDMSG